jgi:peptidoglycan/xylan/chitin deacetylase (PgdA/CDA1 family)
MAFGAILKPALASLAPAAFLYRGAQGGARGVALTFDDGPDPRHTTKLLEILGREGARGAFFLQGNQAEKHPALVREIHAGGHELGNHGYSHRRPGEIGTAAYVEEVLRTQAVLEDCVGERVAPLFRPPYGAMSVRTFMGLSKRGFRFVHWSVDSGDSFITDAGELTAHFAKLPVRAGDILLFHEDQAQTVEALPAMLRAIRERSLGFASIAALWEGRRAA